MKHYTTVAQYELQNLAKCNTNIWSTSLMSCCSWRSTGYRRVSSIQLLFLLLPPSIFLALYLKPAIHSDISYNRSLFQVLRSHYLPLQPSSVCCGACFAMLSSQRVKMLIPFSYPDPNHEHLRITPSQSCSPVTRKGRRDCRDAIHYVNNFK